MPVWRAQTAHRGETEDGDEQDRRDARGEESRNVPTLDHGLALSSRTVSGRHAGL
ncbi:MAG: hypothetical protein MZU91_10725 [Desulfosudis oleivorans]|nr:hypothetical protein [Desulfosudis oleivorans]